MTKRNAISILLSLAISAGALWLFFANEHLTWAGVVGALKGTNLYWLFWSVVVFLFSFWLRALRWHYLLAPIKRISSGPLFSALMIGFMANNLLPAHLGELVRAYVLGRRESVSKSSVLATVVVERIFDGLTILTLFLVSIFFFLEPSSLVINFERGTGGFWNWIAGPAPLADYLSPAGSLDLRLLALLVLAFYLVAMAGVIVIRVRRRWVLGPAEWCCRFLPAALGQRVIGLLGSFVEGLRFNRGRDLFWIVFYSFGVWLTLGFHVWLLCWSLGIDLGFAGAVFVEMAIAIMVMIPAAPGYVGTHQLAGATSLGLLRVPAGPAGAFAWLAWLIGYLPVVAVGFIFLWREGLSLRVLRAEARSEGQ
ncbi:MAG: flippase-like domain-containing protein [Proteobacteria bacterium]|nr:flippase-like domain-containing protein [Pseudomonadota bacterium]MBU1741583.1 flippase-like domain-containing protein [Pseudomonadota bacterium]